MIVADQRILEIVRPSVALPEGGVFVRTDRPQLGILYFRATTTGLIKNFYLWFSGATSPTGTWKFDVRVAGVSQFPDFGDMLAIDLAGGYFDSIEGESIAVTKGDIILLDLRQVGGGSLNGPGVLIMETDDLQTTAVPAGGDAGQVLSKVTGADFDLAWTHPLEVLEYALSDETTDLTTGAAKLTARAPYPFAVSEVRASLTEESSSGDVVIDINQSGTTIFNTDELTIDAGDRTSEGSASPYVFDGAITLADDEELTFDIESAGTDAKGLKVKIFGRKIT